MAAGRWGGVLLLSVVSLVGCDGIFGLEVLDDAGAQRTDATVDRPRDAGVRDAGVDATVRDGGVVDGTVGDSMGGDGAASDGGPVLVGCAAVLARMVGAPIVPPNGWFGLDLSNGAGPDASKGGLTIEEAGILQCATLVEPDVLDAGVLPLVPGTRTATFVVDGNPADALYVGYNVDSHVIAWTQVGRGARSTLTFHARVGGAYDDGGPDGGPTTYVLGIPTDGGTYLSSTRNGVDLPPDFQTVDDDAGVTHASGWENEIYDGLMATYAQLQPAVSDCRSRSYTQVGVSPVRVPACDIQNGVPYIGILPLGVYLSFDVSLIVPVNGPTIAGLASWGAPTCATPGAAVEQAIEAPIGATGNDDPGVGPLWSGTAIANLTPSEPVADARGMLASEADSLLGCSGKQVDASDTGYSFEQWGNGRIELEYNVDSGVVYNVFVRSGYLGTVLTNVDYIIGVGVFSDGNGVPIALDWQDSDGGTLDGVITGISNAWFQFAGCSIYDDDCVQRGNCSIVPDDDAGHSMFTLAMSPSLAASCPDPHPLTFVFARGKSIPVEIYATNPGGK